MNKNGNTRSQSQPVLASNGQTSSGGSASDNAIVAFLDRAQTRDLRKDDGYGYRSVREIAQAVGVEKSACRFALERMVAAGLIGRVQFSNALVWRSITPLPWEVGGSLQVERARLEKLWAEPLTLIVQSVWQEGRHARSHDEKAYPQGLRDVAESHVLSANAESDRRRQDDRWNNRHLSADYQSPPSYRLVSLLPAIAKAEGRS